MIKLLFLDGSVLGTPSPNPEEWLAPEELRRHGTFHSDSRRREFLLGRMLLKAALPGAARCSADFRKIGTALSATGKPTVTGAEFNLSHDGSAVLLAIGDQPVGVDIESVQSFDRAMMEICFTGTERRRISCSPHPDRTATLLWCLKEAAAKAVGTGLAATLQADRNRNLFFRGGFLKTGGVHRAYVVCSPRPLAPVTISPAIPRFEKFFVPCLPERKSISEREGATAWQAITFPG